ncbi:MAG: hypothetical protein LPJ89_02760 [Hymenobacteraceae bacterium]|nr:hypothetical protein [Hymenobacteraceae bacterium]MDX5395918.1 hypothetical protein [Hymenobacteraceae bacterium]MDX5442687.1 hypothetical protein [Hymenobacteraceae bacterium]MDX5511975.1 hypothetical protein [Hymenobacteraceae bacterium]
MNKLFISAFLTVASFAAFGQSKSVAAKHTAASSQVAAVKQDNSELEARMQERANQMTNGMARHLGLSGAQIAKVREINLMSVRQVEEARAKYKNDLKSFQYQMELISDSRLSRIKDVLTPQQFDMYQRKREEKMGLPQPQNSAAPAGGGIQVPGGGGYSN